MMVTRDLSGRKKGWPTVWPLKLSGLLGLFIALNGCSTVRLDAGFDEVKASVEERSKAQIVWNSGSDLDRQVDEKVRSLLAGTLTAEQAVQVALLNNRELQAMYSDLGVAQSDLVQAGLLKNPPFPPGKLGICGSPLLHPPDARTPHPVRGQQPLETLLFLLRSNSC